MSERRGYRARPARARQAVRRSAWRWSRCRGRRACPGARNRARGRRRHVCGLRRSSPVCSGPGAAIIVPTSTVAVSHRRECLRPRRAAARRKHMLTIVFDLDGTLVDTAPDLIGTLNLIFTQNGLSAVPLEASRPLIGGGARAMIERALVAQGRNPSAADVD